MSKKCLACGNNPVSHVFSWISQSCLIAMNPVSAYVAGELFDRFFAYFFSWTFRSSLALFRFLGWLKMNDDIEKAPGLRGKVLWQEAERRGIPMQSLIFCGKYIDGYEVHVGGKKINFAGLPRLPQGSSQWWIDDKAELKKMLQKAGVPVPRGGSFTRFKPLLARFRTLEKPVIIKPRLGSRGRHTTTNISTEEDLKKAYNCAKQLCHWVVMEEHLVGSVYRGTVIDGALVGVLRGDPPRITGDGVKTIAQLVDSKNEHRPKQVSPVVLTSAHEEFLRRMGYTYASVLPAGVTIDILEKIGISYGGYSVEVTSKTHPETKRYLSLAGQVINDPIAGFDFIIQDIEKSPDEQKWGIIECNGLPFINLHHFPVEGEPVNVASAVWDFVEKNIDKY